MDLLDAMEVDVYSSTLNAPSNWEPPPSDDGLLYDEWHIGRKKIERDDGSYYFEMVEHPLANATLEAIRDFKWPDPFAGRTVCVSASIEFAKRRIKPY